MSMSYRGKHSVCFWHGSPLSYEFSSYPGDSSKYSGWTGLTFNLDTEHAGNGKSYAITLPEGEQTLPSELVLDTLSVYTDGTNYTNGMKVIVLDANKTVVGVSSGATISGDSGWRTLTFDFTYATNAVTLSTGTQYYVMWARSTRDQVSEALVGTTLNSFTQYTPNADKLRVAYSSTYTTSEDVGLGYSQGTSSTYITPAVTITTHAVSVPEPATGTLSLLALAGLCGHRRRK